MKKNEPRISHTTSKKVEYYVIRFDGKEFRIVVKDCKRLHKDYDEVTEVEITQIPNQKDITRIHKILDEKLF
jgi:hypothetical protein